MKTLQRQPAGDPGTDEFDDDRDLCTDFVSCFAIKEPYVWAVPGSNLWLYEHKSCPQRGNWSIGETLEDGDERTYCYIRSCGELRTMLPLVLAALEHNDIAYRQSLKPGHRVIVENLKGVRPSLARLVSSGRRHIVVRLAEKPEEELTCLHCEVEILPENTRL